MSTGIVPVFDACTVILPTTFWLASIATISIVTGALKLTTSNDKVALATLPDTVYGGGFKVT
jgi:hypothetical protein